MPSEILHLPPLYTIVGLYRLLTDPSIREPVLDKVRHATVRGLIVGAVYAILGWKPMSWFVQRFLVGAAKVDRNVTVGAGWAKINVNIVLYTHILILLPQLTNILRFFVRKNIRIARERAWALTVASRGKPAEFWSQGYVEEWAQPPVTTTALVKAGRRSHQEVWLKWALWWPTQMVIRHFILLPLSPNLPLLAPVFLATLRALQTAEYLHQPYFLVKRMQPDEVWRWVEERKWAYRVFGFAASLLESFPIAGLFFSISNRVGAAMWAHDLEKRQHLFSAGVLRPLPPAQVGLFGMGAVTDLGVDVQAAEAEIERKWSQKPGGGRDNTRNGSSSGFSAGATGGVEKRPIGAGSEKPVVELKGPGLGVGTQGKEHIL